MGMLDLGGGRDARDLRHAKLNGLGAAHRGHPVTDNPLPEGPLRDAWAEGHATGVAHPRVQETQSCAKGEHMYVTGKRHCPLCGEDL